VNRPDPQGDRGGEVTELAGTPAGTWSVAR
jgi:hypothetical protein